MKRSCDTEVCEDWKTTRNLRLVGPIRRNSKEWKSKYTKRQSGERVFKGMKESRRLERHCVRGVEHMQLHATMSTLLFQATALWNVQQGRSRGMRWMVRRVA